jgi:perosamine synthetase
MNNISISLPSIGKEEYQVLESVLMSGWVTQGPKVREFESKFSDFQQVKSSLAVTSCTTGLQLILAALDIGSGDEVIVPAFTWVSTANVVVHAGATPVFADIDLNTYNIDPKKIKDKITTKTKAIIAVHLFGLCADMEGIANAAPGIPIIEDAACAVGAKHPNGFAGGLGVAGAFSFHPRKTITTGEGGMVTSNDEVLASRMDILRNHGASISEEQRHHGPKPYVLPDFAECGFNFRMTDIQGCIGVEQMKKLPKLLSDKANKSELYSNELAKVKWLATPTVSNGYSHGWQAYVCQVSSEKGPEFRNQLMDYLQDKGISTRPGTHAVHMLDYYKNKFSIHPDDYPNAKAADEMSIALPLHSKMSDEDYLRVIGEIRSWAI